MSERSVLVFPVDPEDKSQVVEGHVLGGKGFIKGDVRSRYLMIEGNLVLVENDTGIKYIQGEDGADRCWFLLDFENGRLKYKPTT